MGGFSVEKIIWCWVVLFYVACTNAEKTVSFPYFPPEDTVRVEFDIEAFNKHRKERAEGLTMAPPTASIPASYVYSSPTGIRNAEPKRPTEMLASYSFISENGNYVIQDSTSMGYSEERFRGIWGDFFLFYPSGKLRSRGFFFTKDGKTSSFSIRNFYNFDEQGKLLSVEDCDAHFKYSLDSIVAFLNVRGLKVWDWSVDVGRGEGMTDGLYAKDVDDTSDTPLREYTGKYEWRLRYVLPNTKIRRDVILDAETGSILCDTIFPHASDWY